MTDLQKKLLAAFDSEHRTVIQRIRASLAQLEAHQATDVALEEAFRMAHTLKGAARVVEFTSVMHLAHRLESVFAAIRSRKIAADLAFIRLTYEVLTTIEDLVGQYKGGQVPDEPKGVLQALDALLSGETPAPALPKAVVLQVEVKKSSLSVVPSSGFTPPTLQVSTGDLDYVLQTASELVSSLGLGEQVDFALDAMAAETAQINQTWREVREAAGRISLGDGAAAKKMVDAVGRVEWSLKNLTRRLRHTRLTQRQTRFQLQGLAEQLHQGVEKARMVAAESVFEGFHQMVRDIARDIGKPIDFRCYGLELAADRQVLQALKDPLMHVLRNSIDHGIEPAAHRSPKDPTGKITLRLQTEGGRLKVTVEDDGRGIDPERVRSKAVQAQLLTQPEADTLTPEAILQLIFEPGFSTADHVTDLSGRGMGLSVVSEAVQKLQGEIQVEARPGKGACFVFTVPIQLTSHRLLLVECGGLKLALPSYGIDRLLRLKVSEITTVEGKPAVLLDGSPIPMSSLAGLVNIGTFDMELTGSSVSIVILKSQGRKIALAVDRLLVEQDAVIKDFGTSLNQYPHLLGSFLIEEGSVVVVLNPSHLVEKTLNTKVNVTFKKADVILVEKRLPIVLVVDDSITTRTLEKGILEANGYQVELAVDGVEALEKLQRQNFDLMITDVEMPRMNGFELVAQVKANTKLRDLPVIMVTSLEKSEDKERGLKLGVDAYMVKQKFDQGSLLEIIRQIL